MSVYKSTLNKLSANYNIVISPSQFL